MNPSALDITVAASFAARGRGLLGQSHLDRNQGLLLVPCSSIHTLFMRFSIDAVFFDRSGLIVRVIVALPAWRFAWGGAANSCLELAALEAARHGFRVGERIACFAREALEGRHSIQWSPANEPWSNCPDRPR